MFAYMYCTSSDLFHARKWLHTMLCLQITDILIATLHSSIITLYHIPWLHWGNRNGKLFYHKERGINEWLPISFMLVLSYYFTKQERLDINCRVHCKLCISNPFTSASYFIISRYVLKYPHRNSPCNNTSRKSNENVWCHYRKQLRRL